MLVRGSVEVDALVTGRSSLRAWQGWQGSSCVTYGWLVPAYPLPPDRENLVVQRIFVRHGVSRDLAELLVGDLHRALELLEKHPPSCSLGPREAGSFSHHATPATR
jgi:hypothetical protein